MVFENKLFGIIRQKGGFSSFSIPNRRIEELIWKIRQGYLERDSEYHEFQREERIWLERIAKEGYCKLIVSPNLELVERGAAATASRIRTLIEFIDANKDIVDVISNDSVSKINLLIVGDGFKCETVEGDSILGYKNTIFEWGADKIEKTQQDFDREFDDLLNQDGLDTYSAKEKAPHDLHKALEKLANGTK